MTEKFRDQEDGKFQIQNNMKIMMTLLFSLAIFSCREKNVKTLVIQCSKERNLAEGLNIFAQIKEKGVSSQTLYEVFEATKNIEEKSRILDISFTLDDPVVFKMLQTFSWKEMKNEEINSILMIERGEKIRHLEKSIDITLDTLLDRDSLRSLSSSRFMKTY